jgi:16S rRNA (cytosine967-C5)-methyltransferase
VTRPAVLSVSPARVVAFVVVRRVFEHGAYADRALRSEAADLDPRDRALATALAYGVVQRRATLDYVLERLAGRPLSKLDAPILAATRLGLLQLLFMHGIAEHAAVNDSVELAKRSSRGGAGLVNAVLRRATREGRAILAELGDDVPAGAAILHSVPEWLAELWFAELGADAARSLLGVLSEPAEAAIRVNTLRARPDEMLRNLPVEAHPAPGLPEAIVLDSPFDAHGSDLFQSGAIMPQSRGSMLVSRTLEPQPGERLLDLCAAPGGKTTHIAALMDGVGEVVAVERHAGRAAALERTCRRMGAEIVSVELGDAGDFVTELPFDRVLVDPPCSGLGTLQSRPDLRWRVSPESIAELAALQARIMRAGAAAVGPGGTLVYSVCTISRAESVEVIDRFLAEHPDFVADAEAVQLRPDRDRTDGFFIARLRRAL